MKKNTPIFLLFTTILVSLNAISQPFININNHQIDNELNNNLGKWVDSNNTNKFLFRNRFNTLNKGLYSASLGFYSFSNRKTLPLFLSKNMYTSNPVKIDLISHNDFNYLNHFQKTRPNTHNVEGLSPRKRLKTAIRNYSLAQKDTISELTKGILWARDKVVFLFDGVKITL